MASTLIIETGSVVTDANSYVSVAEVDAYHVLRGNTAWAGNQAKKEAAIIRATQYIDTHYRYRWKGSRLYSTQSLQWPRYGVVEDSNWETETSYYELLASQLIPSNYIPTSLKHAVCEAALRALTETLDPDLETDAYVKRERIDVIEVEYTVNAPENTVYQIVENILGGLLISANTIKIIRG